MTRKRPLLALLSLSFAAGIALGTIAGAQHAGAQDAGTAAPSVATLLATGETILGQTVHYPDGAAARVTAAVVTLPPGAETGWHAHEVPLFGYVLAGELTVTYEGTGERTYRTGEAFMEAVGTPHSGRNRGTVPMRVLAVFMGAEGLANTVKSD